MRMLVLTDGTHVQYKTTSRGWSSNFEVDEFDQLFHDADIKVDIRYIPSWKSQSMGGNIWLYVFQSRVDFNLIMMVLKAKYS